MGRSNINCYQVPPNGEKFTITQDSGIFPQHHKDYYIFNLGRTTVLVQGWYGTKISWIAVLKYQYLEPGHGMKIVVSNKPYYVTGLKITNSSIERALIHCSKVSGYPLWVKGNYSNRPGVNLISEHLIPFGVRQVSKIQINLESIVAFFLPYNADNVWNKIFNKIVSLLDEKTNLKAQRVLTGEILIIKEDISILQSQIKTFQPSITKSKQYMKIVEQLAFLEKSFAGYKSSDSDYINTNYHLLPLYSATVNLKVILYKFGISNPKLVGLNDEQVGMVLQFLDKLINDQNLGAFKHVSETFRNKFHQEYQQCDPELIYDGLVGVRTWCSLAGFEFVPFWKSVLENRPGKYYNDVITYSMYCGQPSPYLFHQQVIDDIAPPLQPRLIDGRRNQIKGVNVFIWRSKNGQGTAVIGGLNVIYANNDSVVTGRSTSEINYVDFKNDQLMMLAVWGKDAIKCLEFSFFNGRIERYGTKDGEPNVRRFSLEDHHIVGFYMANDIPYLDGQAANIAVSFQILSN